MTLFFLCNYRVIQYFYQLNFDQFTRAFFIAFIPCSYMFYTLVEICFNVFRRKKVNLEEIGMIVLFSYSTTFIGIVVEEFKYVPFSFLSSKNTKN